MAADNVIRVDAEVLAKITEAARDGESANTVLRRKFKLPVGNPRRSYALKPKEQQA